FQKLCGSFPVRQGEAFRSVQARRAAVTIGLPSLGREWKGWARKIVAIAGLITRVAWLIPYCARHHPLQSEKQRVPGTPSTSFSQGRAAGLAFTARVHRALHPPRPGTNKS